MHIFPIAWGLCHQNTHTCPFICRGWLLVEAQSVSTWEPAVDTTDPSTSALKDRLELSARARAVCGD